MVEPALIEPQAIYDDGAVLAALGIPSTTLTRARREGRLRHTRKGRRVFYLGQWVLDWIKADVRQGVAHDE
jgi:hypothetical protein